MDSPMQQDSPPPAVKQEQQEDVNMPTYTTEPDYINLLSDDEDAMDSPTTNLPPRRLASPFKENAALPTTSGPVDLGFSLFSTNPTDAQPSDQDAKPKVLSDAIKQRLRDRQKELAQKLKKRTPVAESPVVQTPIGQPLGANSNATSPLFVTQRTEDNTPTAETPVRPAIDPAKQYTALHRAYAKKKKSGKITVEEEIEFIRAESDERARIERERREGNFDEMESPEPEREPGLEDDYVLDYNALNVPGFELSDDDEPEEPKKKGGRKRKAGDEDSAPPKKRGRPTKAEKAARGKEKDVLELVRDKVTAKKAHGKKAGGKAAAGKGKGKGKKYKGPSMMNQGSMFGSNVFKDAEKIKDLADQPTFEGTHQRGNALKQLIAEVPAEKKRLAQVDRRYLEQAIQSFTGRTSLRPAEDGTWHLKGMKVTLKHYQVLGTAFMRQRENSTKEPKGGILADQMGLGKTIMMLANILNGKSLVGKKKCKTTLIVASPALVAQWRREISDKVCTEKEDKKYGIGRVKEFSASAQLRSNQEQEELEDCDIVLTTWTMVNKSFPKADIPAEKVTAESKAAWWKEHWELNRGVLHRIKFHRVVLDEAHGIKNHRSLTSQACRAITATHHWAISGTPIQNNIKEFYAYFKFLKEPHTGSYKLFKSNFASPDDPEGSEKLGVFLRKFLIRRTHLDRLFDARLLDLPQPKEHTLRLDFNEVEKTIYDIVRTRFIQRINCIAKSGDLEKQYNHIWCMLLRLRQLCGHVALIQGTIVDLLEWEDFERLSTIVYNKEDENAENCENLLRHLSEKVKETHSAKHADANAGNTIITKSESTAIQIANAEGSDTNIGGSHGLTYRFGRYLDSLLQSNAWEQIQQRTLCSGCRQPPQEPHVTSCMHIYCFACLTDLQHRSARRGRDVSRCSECGADYTHVARCESAIKRFASTTANDDDDIVNITGKKPRKPKTDDIENWICMKGEVLPSAKTLAVKAQVLDWINEDPTVKIIIYSQFIPMLHILGRVCRTEHWEFERYTGGMSHDSREKAINDFADPTKNRRILLASLKCGGLGLNLTMASRVITLDPWWNYSVEQQAFCRVFRIGQQKETRMLRLVVKNTIDEAIVALQEAKQIQIDAVMDDSKRKEKLSINDLMRLFGKVGEDGEGRPFIFAEGANDEEVDPEHLRPIEANSDDEEDMMGNEE